MKRTEKVSVHIKFKPERKFYKMKKIKILSIVTLIFKCLFLLGQICFFIIGTCFIESPIFYNLCRICFISFLIVALVSYIIEKSILKKETLKVRNTSSDICDLFEELLDKYNINVPSKDRAGDETEARLYGESYSELEDSVTEILSNLCTKVKNNPYVNIDIVEY